MQTDLVISAAMLIISLVLAAAMAIAWFCFGHRRYAASWGVGYLLYAVEILVAGSEAAFAIPRRVAEPVEFAFILIPAVMIAVGARQRAGMATRGWRMFTATIFIFVIVEAFRSLKVAPWLSITDGIFTSVMLCIAISAIWPRLRRLDPAEWVTMATLGAFTIFELSLVIADLLGKAYPGNDYIRFVYDHIYAIGLMPVFVANGIAAILLIASDLARQLRLLSMTDPLTGLLNRRGFHDAAMLYLEGANRRRKPVIVVLADIDHFKSVNDSFGHAAGDATLRYVTQQLVASFGKDALIGRVGGEEFAIVLSDYSPEGAATAVDSAREAIARNAPADSSLPVVTVSFGVAATQPAGSNLSAILALALDHADAALYRSKVGGRNRVTLTDSQTLEARMFTPGSRSGIAEPGHP